jgi:hypothetical protein
MSSASESLSVPAAGTVDAGAERRVINASSGGTVFEWYDLYH